MDEKDEVKRLREEFSKKEQRHKDMFGLLARELRYRSSDAFVQRTITDFKKSGDFSLALAIEVGVYLDWGGAHMTRQLYYEINDLERLARLFSPG